MSNVKEAVEGYLVMRDTVDAAYWTMMADGAAVRAKVMHAILTEKRPELGDVTLSEAAYEAKVRLINCHLDGALDKDVLVAILRAER